LGTKYVYPYDAGVTVTFTCLPKDEALRSQLKIERVKISDLKLPEGVNLQGEYAYDITTGMENGTFEYTVTFPKPEGKTAEVSYIEKSVTEAKDTQLTADDIKPVEESKVNQEGNTVKVTNLDHFTIFIATYSNSSFSVEKSVYARGETVYVKAGGGLNNSKYYRIAINPPGSSNTFFITNCQKGDVSPTITGTYVLPSNATVSTDWKAELKRYNNSSDCTNGNNEQEDDEDSFEVVAPRPTPLPNPTLPSTCGLDIALVIDSSGSIDGSMDTMKNAFKAFVDALTGTPTQFSVTDFDTTASVTKAFTSDAAQVKAAIESAHDNGWTNWEDGLIKGRSTFDPRTKPNLVIFASDGNPNTIVGGSGGGANLIEATDKAVLIANDLKSTFNSRILVIGITGNEGLNMDSLKAISGTNVNSGNILTSDVITTDFNGLATQLANFAKATCGGTITVNKYIDTISPTTRGGAGWMFAINGATKTTDSNGQTEAVTIPGGSTVSVTETGLLAGYSYGSATCKKSTGAGVGSPISQGVGSITVGTDDIISCDFINTENKGSIQVGKEIDTNGDGTYDDLANSVGFKWGYDSGSVNRNMGTVASNVPYGSHTVSESTISGYHFTGWYSKKGQNTSGKSCTHPEGTTYPVSVTVSSDSDASAIILCNARNTGTITVDKVTNPSGDPTDFNFNLLSTDTGVNQNFTLKDLDAPFNNSFATGVYKIEEKS
ncbi:VWA domain-containing protein, partial [Patescibacteria group bacterium]|nr:VWA domain-containing protein [Patescibacteria group bacterium]